MEKKNSSTTFSLLMYTPVINFLDNCIYLKCSSLRKLIKLKNILIENKDYLGFVDFYIPALPQYRSIDKENIFNFKNYKEFGFDLNNKKTRNWLIKKPEIFPNNIKPILVMICFLQLDDNFDKVVNTINTWTKDNNIYIVSRDTIDNTYTYLESLTNNWDGSSNKKSIYVEKDRFYKLC